MCEGGNPRVYVSETGTHYGPLSPSQQYLWFLGVQRVRHLVDTSTTHPSSLCTPHTPVPSPQNRATPLNMDITGHFESASCVIEVDGSDTLAQVKGKLLGELGVPRARHVGVRMKGGGDIGNDDLRICDTVMDEGCAVELYYTGANITPGVLHDAEDKYSITLSPCDRYVVVMWMCENTAFIFDTETHESLCHLPSVSPSKPSFSPCSSWISCVNEDTERAEVYDVKTGALVHSFGEAGASRRWGTAWSPCGTKLLSCCSKGLQVWDIATGVVVREWGNIVECERGMVVAGDRVATFTVNSNRVTIWDYTTGAEILVLTCLLNIEYVALTPNQRFIAVCGGSCVRVWNIETGECVFEDVSENDWTDVAVSNDVVASYSSSTLCVWSISTEEQLLHRKFENKNTYGVAISSCGGVVMYAGDEDVEIVCITQLS